MRTVAQMVGSLPSMWMEVHVPGFILVQLWLLQAFGEMNQHIEHSFIYLFIICVYVFHFYLCLSHRWKIFENRVILEFSMFQKNLWKKFTEVSRKR